MTAHLLRVSWAQVRVAFLVAPYRLVTAAYACALDDLIALREHR